MRKLKELVSRIEKSVGGQIEPLPNLKELKSNLVKMILEGEVTGKPVEGLKELIGSLNEARWTLEAHITALKEQDNELRKILFTVNALSLMDFM